MATTKIRSSSITDGQVSNADLSSTIGVTGDQIADDAITAAKLDTTGTASASTYLSGTMAWTAISSEDSVKVLTKTGTDYTITSGDVSDVGTLYVLVDPSGADRVITLPAPADYSGCVIKIIKTGSGDKVEVKNSGDTEVWTCYAVGDFYSAISDGTSNFKAAGKVTVYGKMYASSNLGTSGRGFYKIVYDTLEYDSGGWGNITDDRIDVAFDCIIQLESVVNSEKQGHPTWYVDGSNWLDTHNSSYESSGYIRNVPFTQKVLASDTPIEMYYYIDYVGAITLRGGQRNIYATWKVLERL